MQKKKRMHLRKIEYNFVKKMKIGVVKAIEKEKRSFIANKHERKI